MWFHIHRYKVIFKKLGLIKDFDSFGNLDDHEVCYFVEECKCGKRIGYVTTPRNRRIETNPDIVLQKIGDIDIWEDFQAKQKLEWIQNLKEENKGGKIT